MQVRAVRLGSAAGREDEYIRKLWNAMVRFVRFI